MNILNELNRAMVYIEEHITDDITPEDVAGVTTYSPYHFGRLFYYITDIPLSEYIRKRKLSLAAMALQTDDIKIIDLAVMYGYDSADSFSRAFAKQHGITPSAARQSGVQLKIFAPLTFEIKIEGVNAMNWRIEERESFEVFGIERVFKNEDSAKVPDFWSECHQNGSCERLFNAAGCDSQLYKDCNPFDTGACVINAACGCYQSGDDSFPYMLFATATPQSKTDDFKKVIIPKATWAVFRSEISDSIGLEIPKLFSRAYSQWMPSSGYIKAEGPDMEIYYTTPDGKHFEEVWLPVKKQ